MEQQATIVQQVNKFPASYGAQKFTVVFTEVQPWSLSRKRSFKINFNAVPPGLSSSVY
jgi:uncharacterized cupin superfamily protein